MAVEHRPNSRFWYGRWQRNKQRFSKRLGVPVVGEPGSDEFEASRMEAEAALARIIAEADRKQRPEELVQAVHELKFGKRVGSISLARLPEEWESLPRKRALSRGRVTFGRTVTKRFIAFVQSKHPKVRELAAVTSDIAEAFMREEVRRKVSGRTYNATLSLLRGAFERLRVRAGMISNPFKENLVMKDEDSIHRKPFAPAELNRLFEVAKEHDPQVYGLITVGACTALRRGDACCLKWTDVNLEANSIRVAVRKTGQPVLIPIFPRLREVLEGLRKTGSPYVFPALAEAYLGNSSAVGKRLNRVFALAGFGPDAGNDDGEHEGPVIDVPSDDDLRPRVLAKIEALDSAAISPRVKASLVEVFDLYTSGMTLPDIANKLAVSKGTVSNHLARIEKIAGHPIIRKEVQKARDHALAAESRRTAEVDDAKPVADGQPRRLKRVNDRGFHSLRATFATLALTSGVPVEVLRIITGHTLTETVLRHYFNPHKTAVLKSVEDALPRMLTQGGEDRPSLKVEALELVDALNPRTVAKLAPRLRELIGKLRE